MPEPEEYKVTVSKRATQQLVEAASFQARLDEKLAHKLVAEFRIAVDSLRILPFRNPTVRSEVFTVEKYRKMVFGKWYLLIYQIKGDTVYIEYLIDGRSDYQWLFA